MSGDEDDYHREGTTPRDTHGVSVEDILHVAMPILLDYIDKRMHNMFLNGQVGNQDHNGDVVAPRSASTSSPLYPATPPQSQALPRPPSVQTIGSYSSDNVHQALTSPNSEAVPLTAQPPSTPVRLTSRSATPATRRPIRAEHLQAAIEQHLPSPATPPRGTRTSSGAAVIEEFYTPRSTPSRPYIAPPAPTRMPSLPPAPLPPMPTPVIAVPEPQWPTPYYPAPDGIVVDLSLLKSCKTWYCVWIGFRVGVYTSWADALMVTNRCPGAGHRSHKSLREAVAEYDRNFANSNVTNIPWEDRTGD